MDGFGVGDVVLQRLLIQEVEEILDGQWDGPTGAEDSGEQVVHELLQRSLRGNRDNDVASQVNKCTHKGA